MKKLILSCLILLTFQTGFAQPDVPIIQNLDLSKAPPGKVSKFWLHVVSNGLAQPVLVPVMVARGVEDGPVLGLTAAIHGNELNGIPVIQEVFQKIDPTKMKGTLVGVPGLNVPGMEMEQREYPGGDDLNRLFPGKADGDQSQQYAYYVFEKIIRHFDVLVDMHTASFGRVNSHYVRADMSDTLLAKLALLQFPDIIVSNQGQPSAGSASTGGRTLRAEASLNGIPCLTIEFGNPQVYQREMIERGVEGILNAMSQLGMIDRPVKMLPHVPFLCKKSYWLYTDEGGLLEVPVELAQPVRKGELTGVLKNPFGGVVREYFAPEDGIIIGKSTNPVNRSGGRIVHLGVR